MRETLTVVGCVVSWGPHLPGNTIGVPAALQEPLLPGFAWSRAGERSECREHDGNQEVEAFYILPLPQLARKRGSECLLSMTRFPWVIPASISSRGRRWLGLFRVFFCLLSLASQVVQILCRLNGRAEGRRL